MSPGSDFAVSGSVLFGATALPENQPCLTAPIPLLGSTG